ncbi:ABC transporter permease [Agromyces atrinae]|uniref:ABC transporter permease n=1 Tax=Agromyces atrinae TaxID=592376 RepID=A0A4Q2MCJ1_9MICO|nr:ABC transporter permease [Agromyces atrinae]NYD68090.1 peptide/nickel transport system permease protein [Agromyces atrinae]RXZ87762.1 ABC transporter permease [Agromyces atrinae]
MIRFLSRRVISGILTLIAISAIMFLLFYVAPNDPARTIAGVQATNEQVELVRERLGLNLPVIDRYFLYMGGLLQGDLGYSFYNQQPVLDSILQRLPQTASIAIGGLTLALALGVTIGIGAARRPGSIRDRFSTVFVLSGLSVPTFVVGLLLLYLLFYQLTVLGLPIFPAAGYVDFATNPFEWARHLLLPWITVGFVSAATYARLTRSQLAGVLGEDYIRTARAKGLTEGKVVYKHGMRSALTPVVTQVSLDIAVLMGGLVVTEQIFGINGIGRLAIQSVNRGDQPVIIGTMLLASLFVVISSILVDIVYALLDSRVRVK